MPRPANDVKRLGAILLVGAVAGLGASYVASRKRPAHWTDGGLIDWDTVRQIAVQFSQHTQAPVHNRAAAREQYTSMVRRAEPLIAAYLQVNLPEPIQRIVVMDRKEWLSANIDNFTHLFRFVEELYARNARPRTIGASLAAGVNRRLMSVQIGLLLGVIARRVLGQYDLSLLAPEPKGGALYFVEPNIERIQRMLGLDAHDFRMWIALHEATHAYEFEAYPWVREHFNGLLRRYFDTVNEQLQGFKLSLIHI